MAGGETAAIAALLRLVREIGRISGGGFGGNFKRDCSDLGRRIALLSHLIDEIRDLKLDFGQLNASGSSSSSSSCLSDLTVALQAAKRLLLSAGNFVTNISSVSIFQYCVCIYIYIGIGIANVSLNGSVLCLYFEHIY